MENLYISKRVLTKKNLFATVGYKTMYRNPYDRNELIIDDSHKMVSGSLDLTERLDFLYQIVEEGISPNINLPLRKVFVDNRYVGYTLHFIRDAFSFVDLAQTNSIATDVKLEILTRFDTLVKTMHRFGIVSCDLNPTNLLLDDNFRPHIIDVIDGQYSDFLINSYDSRLGYFYNRRFFNDKNPHNVDNVSMHFNLLYALTGNNDIDQLNNEEYSRFVRKLKAPKMVKETFDRMRDYTDIETIPYVSETIKQM